MYVAQDWCMYTSVGMISTRASGKEEERCIRNGRGARLKFYKTKPVGKRKGTIDHSISNPAYSGFSKENRRGRHTDSDK